MFTDFTVADGAADGSPVSLSDYVGTGKSASGGIFSYNPANIFCSDCFGMSTMVYDVAMSTMSSIGLAQMYTWQMKWLASTNEMMSEWVTMYEAIYTANIVLSNLDNVSGSEEQKAEVRGRAYTLRAYSYNALLECYCLPYGQSTLTTPGLPRKTRPDYEESPARRPMPWQPGFI